MTAPAYAELQAITNFSFLRGGSHAHELVARAKELGLTALGVADRNTLAGVVRAHVAAKEFGLRLIVGARLDLICGLSLIAYPSDRAAYARLSSLITKGKMAAPKGECILSLDDVHAHAKGQIFLAIAPDNDADARFAETLGKLASDWPNRVYLAAAHKKRGDDRARLAHLATLSEKCGAPLVAVGDVLYHAPERKPLQDVLACIREKTTVQTAGRRLEKNADRHLKSPAEMARLFRGYEDAVARSAEIAARCRFSLDELAYDYPDEPVPPGKTPQGHLEELAWRGAAQRYPDGLPEKVRTNIEKELALIAELNYAPYFLTVYDIVAWARAQGILCQGRGSAANSTVCYCLGVTAVDPARIDLLFERFISRERKEPPDIDVDFEHERREEVIQYIYARYGRMRASLTATVISYRSRSAAREVCKALGLTEDVAAALAGTVWGSHDDGLPDAHIREAGLDPKSPIIAAALHLARELTGFPRHLSQHVGGFVLTRGPLCETVPIGNAAMEDRSFIEWDKDDIDALGILKVDVLGLGMLTCIRKCFDLIAETGGPKLTLASVPPEDPSVYDMLCAADSIGVFQVESRAQMNMLPRLRPRNFYDLVIEVAIVRPGPIQGDMVHPYLRRRNGEETVAYPAPSPEHGPADELKRVLGRTLGVPLFQEQAMRIAIEAAHFTPDEANGLRRAMATFRRLGTIHKYQEKMVEGMVARGYARDFAERCFHQIEGFGEYGFPESHAASFALLVYVSAWLKKHYPAAFACGLLNAQPMGFYAPAQIIRCARDHGVEVRQVDVNASEWDNTLEQDNTSTELSAPPAPIDPASGRPPSACFADTSPVNGGGKNAASPANVLPPFTGEVARPQAGSTGREANSAIQPALRLGLRQVDGLAEAAALAVTDARRVSKTGAFKTVEEVRRRANVSRAALEKIAAADGFGSLGLSRRQGLWAVRGLPDATPPPLFAFADAADAGLDPETALKPMTLGAEVVADYETLRLSLKAHPMALMRPHMEQDGAMTAAQIAAARNNSFACAAGVVLIRQMPGSAKGVVFVTLEDETGVVNLIVWPKTFARTRKTVMGARLIMARGRVQSADGVVHLVAEEMEDRTQDLSTLSEEPLRDALSRADEVKRAVISDNRARGHPRNARILPRSRDFH